MHRAFLAAVLLAATTACGEDAPTPPPAERDYACGQLETQWEITTTALIARMTLAQVGGTDSVTGSGASVVRSIPLTANGTFRRDTLRLRLDGWIGAGDQPRYVMLTCPVALLPHAFRGFFSATPSPTSGERITFSRHF